MFVSAPEWNILLMAVTIFLMWISKVDMRTLKIYVPVAISMGSIIFLSYTVLGGTHPEFELLARIGPVNFYWERVRDAIVVYFRVLPMIFTMVFFLSTSRERDIIVAMRSIKVPFVVTYIFAMALRAAGMVLEDFQIVRQAEKARGYDPAGKSIAYKVRQYIMYMVPLFALLLRRSEEFTNALVARGYAFTGSASSIKRADFILTHYSFKYYDYLIIALIGMLFLALLVFRYGFGAFVTGQSVLLSLLYTALH